MNHPSFLTTALAMTMACASLTHAGTPTPPAAGENAITLESKAVHANIEPTGARFEIRDGAGRVIAPMHAESGVRFAAHGEEKLTVANIQRVIARDASSLTARLENALTPLPIAFPDDPKTYDLASSRTRQYAWMIGRSLLATPLYGQDYATATRRDVDLPAGNWMDWDTGEVLEGGQTYSDYPLPPEKIPLFVGGDGIFVLRMGGELFAYYFPLNEGSVEYTFTFPDGKSTSTIVTPAATQGDFTVNAADGAAVEIKRVPERNGYFFQIEPGKRYAIECIEMVELNP